MKTILTAAMDAIEAGEVIVTGALKIVPVDPLEDSIFVWGGHGPIDIDGDTYLGLGNSQIVQRTSGVIGGVAQGLEITLSGIEPAALAFLDVSSIKNASCVVYRLFFAPDAKTLLDAHIFERGRLDTVDSEEVIGADAAIKVAIESAARGLGRSGARMRADGDQRLINPDDGYFKFTAYAAEKMLYWGGKKPARTGDAVSGGGIGGVTIGEAIGNTTG